MTDKQFTIADMIGATQDESPSEFQAAFNALVLDKIHDAINAKKVEIANNYFNYEDEPEEEAEAEAEEETSDADSNEGTTDEDTETVAGKEDGQG